MPPASIVRLPRPPSPTTSSPVLPSSEPLPVTVTAPDAPAWVPTSKPTASVPAPVTTVAWASISRLPENPAEADPPLRPPRSARHHRPSQRCRCRRHPGRYRSCRPGWPRPHPARSACRSRCRPRRTFLYQKHSRRCPRSAPSGDATGLVKVKPAPGGRAARDEDAAADQAVRTRPLPSRRRSPRCRTPCRPRSRRSSRRRRPW